MSYDRILATFRGEHAFDPDHLKAAYVGWLADNDGDGDVAEEAVADWVDATLQRISESRCPRCAGPLVGASLVDEHVFRLEDEWEVREHLASQPDDGAGAYLPASRITTCRCVPVCRLCENDEAIVGVTLAWPMDRRDIVERLRAAYGNTRETRFRSRG